MKIIFDSIEQMRELILISCPSDLSLDLLESCEDAEDCESCWKHCGIEMEVKDNENSEVVK